MEKRFRFKKFELEFGKSAQKVTTDSVLLGSWVDMAYEPENILDIGTGTGLLALMMAQKYPRAEIDAIEIDPVSVEECNRNFIKSRWADRLSIREADFGDFVPGKRYDLIISNPPYFSETILSGNQRRNMARHETNLNVDSLIRKGSKWLTRNGSIALVCPWKLAPNVRLISEISGLVPVKECEVITVEGRRPSLILIMLSSGGVENKGIMTVRNSRNEYTEEYRNLTSEFYLFLH